MSIRDQKPLRVVLYEGRDSTPLEGEQRFTTVSRLLQQGFAITRVGGAGRTAPADDSAALVLGRFGGEKAADFSAGTSNGQVRVRDITGLDAEQVAAEVEAARSERQAPAPGAWKPWFPVIDYDRCTNCMQCLSFCLFGVYGASTQGGIQVQQPDNCKTNCPACSRVCPEAAIMFPKYKAGPINGDVVKDSDLQREKMKIDISALLGGDIYSMLRQRSERAQSRFSKERDSDKALNERQKCLTKLAQAGDIPAEVLMSLPTPDEILRRAGEARAKAQAALAVQQR
jgi:NAD-dependent dihydropyrimidine dehydrogenase PreA subunit